MTNFRGFASKMTIIKSICSFKNQEDKYLQSFDFLRDVRHIVSRQLITIQDVQYYLTKNKDKIGYTFIKNEVFETFKARVFNL